MRLKELFLKEDDRSTAVFAFGRFNPPTIGHQKLLQATTRVARKEGGKAHIFGSHSQDKKKNPLTHTQKMHYLSKMFPKEMRGQDSISALRTAIDVAVHLNDHDRLVMVVGSDRVNDFQNLLDKYNGVNGRHGYYSYSEIKVVSAGERDPDAEGVTGMSASKMRAAAGSGDYESFKLGLPKGYDGTQLFNDVRKGMGINREIKPDKPVAEMNDSEFKREQYFQNLIFTIGEWVEDIKTGIQGEVVKRGTNYVTIVQEDFSLHKVWLENAKSIKEQNNKLPPAINFVKNRNLWEKYRRESYLAGTDDYAKHCKKITPGETMKIKYKSIYQESLSKFASKFKIPMNVAGAIFKKMVDNGLDPLKIQNYSSLLTTYMNLMDEKIREVAPPGKEKVVKALKKKFDDPSAPYAIAWAQYNKEKGNE